MYAIHAASKSVERGWRDLSTSHGGKLRYFHDYLSRTPLTPLGERVFEMKGPLAGVWECEVGGGARLQYIVDQQRKVVVIKLASISHP